MKGHGLDGKNKHPNKAGNKDTTQQQCTDALICDLKSETLPDKLIKQNKSYSSKNANIVKKLKQCRIQNLEDL